MKRTEFLVAKRRPYYPQAYAIRDTLFWASVVAPEVASMIGPENLAVLIAEVLALASETPANLAVLIRVAVDSNPPAKTP